MPKLTIWGFVLVLSIMPNVSPAGGGPENVAIIVDPQDPESLYVANYYRTARNIPESNLLYMDPGAANYPQFTQFHLPALFGMLENRGLTDHIDYIVVPPGGSFFVSAQNLVDAGGCPSLVRRFSASSVYTLAFDSEEILSTTLDVFESNRFYANKDTALAFDSETSYLNGSASQSSNARRYFIGFMLGYTGERGNTIEEIVANIDRSVAVDGSRPDGTFYFMKTDDEDRSPPRDPHFPSTIASIETEGGVAEQIEAFLPIGRHDCLGVLTGMASPEIVASDFTVLDGAFCDHLTSYAARFDTSSQTKISQWIIKGASGSMGTVEEPCVFPPDGNTGKFPHPRLHLWYYKGLSLGESLMRSVKWAPYQCLFYGDPLTRPFAYISTVTIPDAPVGSASGEITLTPQATTTHPTAAIASFELLIDGRTQGAIIPGAAFILDTTILPDGYHDLRVIAYEDSPIRTQGRWTGSILVDNSGKSVTLSADATSGDLSSIFNVTPTAAGGPVSEIQLLHHQRVIAATNGASDSFPIAANVLGAGSSRLIALALFEDGSLAQSEPLEIDVTFSAAAASIRSLEPLGNSIPTAHAYTLEVLPGQPLLLDLPATDADGASLSLTITSDPSQSDIVSGANTQLLIPDATASGVDTLTFRASDGQADSEPAVVTIEYCSPAIITDHPANQTACQGDDIVYSVTALGDGLTYQWLRDGVPIPGATSSDLFLESVSAPDESLYSVTVTNRCRMLTNHIESDAALLDVLMKPQVVSDPTGDDLCVGGFFFPIVATIHADTFQWFKDGDPIDGATDSFLSVPFVTPSDAGAYTVLASNDCGADESEPAILTVSGCGFGDSDDDGDIDFADFGGLQVCFTGPAGPAPLAACDRFDMDADGDVDLTDYEDFAILAGVAP